MRVVRPNFYDPSTRGGPCKWAERAIAGFDRYSAAAIVMNLSTSVARWFGVRLRACVRTCRSSRFGPDIAALYALGRISHVGTFSALEDQMCRMTASGYEG